MIALRLRCLSRRLSYSTGGLKCFLPGTQARRPASVYTLIETAKINAVDPHAWLADTLARIPGYKITKVDDLLPWRWNS